MDLSQTKLTKEEWNALEVPTTGREYDIINMIHNAGDNLNIYIKVLWDILITKQLQ